MANSTNEPQKMNIDPNKVLTSESGEDVIAEDIKKAKGALDKLTSSFKKKAAPMATPMIQKAESSSKNVFSEKTYKKVIKLAVVIMVIIVFVFLALRIFFFLKPGESTTTDISVTPTTFTHASLGKTIYADDDDIVRITKDLTVLKNEIDRTPVKDTTLTPPSLDMNVSF